MAKIEFLKYTGHWPNLCRGDLYVRIDGQTVHFGSCYDGNAKHLEKDRHGFPLYPRFWESGGCVTFDEDWSEDVEEGPWELISHDEFPEEMKSWLPELIRIFNEKVEWGCCGGCV